MGTMSARSEAKWCLMVSPESTPKRPLIMALTEDCIPAARKRGWLLLAWDKDVLKAENDDGA